MDPRKGGGRAPRPGLDTQDTAGQSEPVVIVAEATNRARRAARERLAAEHRRLRNARLADRVMPLAVHYGARPLLAVPLGELDSGGRWVA